MRISDWSSDVCSSDLVELSRKFGDLGEIRDHARRTLPEREALAANRELYARPRPTYLRAEAGRDGREVSDIAHIAFIEALRSEENTSELQSIMRNAYAVFGLNKKKINHTDHSIRY